MMFAKKTHDVLTLLAFTIFADKRIFASEVQAFMTAAQSLPHFQNSDVKMSEARLLAWFEENRLPLRKRHNDGEFGPWFTALLARLRTIEYKNEILLSLWTIVNNKKQKYEWFLKQFSHFC